MAAKLTAIPILEQLSPLVFRVLGCNPGSFTLQGTNTYLVGSGASRILIDTGEPNKPDYIKALKEALEKLETDISTIVCTHWHHDHVGGANEVIAQLATNKDLKIHKIKRADQPDDATAAKNGYEWIQDEHEFVVEGATLRAVATPGHTTDHFCLLLKEENTVFSGDCILGEGTAVFDDLYTYMMSLDKLLTLKPNKIYPGHGPVINDPEQRITEYIAHRNQREAQILDYLTKAGGACNILSIVNGVYGWLSPPLFIGATNNVNNHLKKLQKEGKVEKCMLERWQLTKNKL